MIYWGGMLNNSSVWWMTAYELRHTKTSLRLWLINSLSLMAGLVGFRLIFLRIKKTCFLIIISTVKQEILACMTILQFLKISKLFLVSCVSCQNILFYSRCRKTCFLKMQQISLICPWWELEACADWGGISCFELRVLTADSCFLNSVHVAVGEVLWSFNIFSPCCLFRKTHCRVPLIPMGKSRFLHFCGKKFWHLN